MPTPRLRTGDVAPEFFATTFEGVSLKLKDYRGQRVLLSFFRYASCPFCNFRISELVRMQEHYRAQGLVLLAVFESPGDSVLQYLSKHGASFPIIADPKRRLYEKYRVRASWLGLLRGGLHLQTLARAFARGFLPGRIEGEAAMLPAEFLIGPDGRIEGAYYGQDVADHLPLALLDQWLQPVAGEEAEFAGGHA